MKHTDSLLSSPISNQTPPPALPLSSSGLEASPTPQLEKEDKLGQEEIKSSDILSTASLLPKTPSLWNPNSAGLWSLLFTPAFGSYVQMLNWRELGEDKKAQTSQIWFYISLGFLALVLISSIFIPEESGDAIIRASGLAFLIGWYAANGHQQGKYVKEQLSNVYVKKPWLPALGYAVLGFGGYILAALLVGIVYGLILVATGNA